MKKIVILGCENSHANQFLSFIRDKAEFSDIEVVGVYSDDTEAAKKLGETYGVPVLANYADKVGEVDGVVVTARHGDNHLKYARPYINSGVPMFIDKPITVSESEAVEMMRLFRENGVRFTGGSSLKHDASVGKLRAEHRDSEGGRTVGGLVRAPYQSENPYGGFFFYAQHLVEMVLEIFGRFPLSVLARRTGGQLSVRFDYGEFDCYGLFVDGNYKYWVERMSESGNTGYVSVSVDNDWFVKEFGEFYDILVGGEQKADAREFIAPVFVMNAIVRSLESGKDEAVTVPEV